MFLLERGEEEGWLYMFLAPRGFLGEHDRKQKQRLVYD